MSPADKVFFTSPTLMASALTVAIAVENDVWGGALLLFAVSVWHADVIMRAAIKRERDEYLKKLKENDDGDSTH